MPKPSVLIYVVGDRVGDALLKLPVIATLPQAFPGHRLVWVAGKRISAFCGPLKPLVADIFDEVRDQAGLGVRATELLGKPLSGEHFDVVIDTQQRLLTTLILRRISSDLFISPTAGFRFSDRKPARRSQTGSVRERLGQLVELASGHPVEMSTKLCLAYEYRQAAHALLPAGPVYVGLAPGAGGANKRWPLDNYVAVAREQTAQGRVPVFFLGPQERAWHPQLATQLPSALFPELSYTGSLPYQPLLAIALAERLQVAVANDAGSGHLLAAGKVPLVSLFGPTSAEKFVAPSARRVIISARDYGGSAIQLIPVDAVVEQIELLLQRLPGNRNKDG